MVERVRRIFSPLRLFFRLALRIVTTLFVTDLHEEGSHQLSRWLTFEGHVQKLFRTSLLLSNRQLLETLPRTSSLALVVSSWVVKPAFSPVVPQPAGL